MTKRLAILILISSASAWGQTNAPTRPKINPKTGRMIEYIYPTVITPARVTTMDGTNKVWVSIEEYMASTGSFSGADWVFNKISIEYPASGIRTYSSDSVYVAVPKRGRKDATVKFVKIDPSKIKALK